MTRCPIVCLNKLTAVDRVIKILCSILADPPNFKYFKLKLKNLFLIRLVSFGISIAAILILNPASYAELKDDFINKQKRFINELYNNKNYFDCIAETQRLLDYSKSFPDQKEFNYLIDTCYFYGRQYKTVISRLQNMEGPPGEKYNLLNLFLLSSSYYNTGYYNTAREILFGFNYSDVNEISRSDLFINRAGLLINNSEYQNILNEIENAGKYFTRFNSFTLSDFKKDMEAYREIGFRSKWLSLSLSAILPGAGQFYSGRDADGLLSLAAVAGSACGALYFYNKKERPLALTFTFFSCLFYAGNLYGAYNSAEYTNKRLDESFSSRIRNKYNLHYNPADYLDNGIFK